MYKKITHPPIQHIRKSRVLSPLRCLRTCVSNEKNLVPLACKDVNTIACAMWESTGKWSYGTM